MEKAILPLKYMKITQGVGGSYSHKGTYSIDFGWKDDNSRKLYAPFTGRIKKIYTKTSNAVWLESIDKVEWADGTIDYMTILIGHDNDVSDLKTGQVIQQGQYFYKMGNKGQATGVHVHMEVGKGKFTGTGWHKNKYGIWMINNAVHPVNAFFLDNDIEIDNDGNYNWKYIPKKPITNPIEGQTPEDDTNIEHEQNANTEALKTRKIAIYDLIIKLLQIILGFFNKFKGGK